MPTDVQGTHMVGGADVLFAGVRLIFRGMRRVQARFQHHRELSARRAAAGRAPVRPRGDGTHRHSFLRGRRMVRGRALHLRALSNGLVDAHFDELDVSHFPIVERDNHTSSRGETRRPDKASRGMGGEVTWARCS